MSDKLSIPEGVYQDVKRLIRAAVQPIVRPILDNWQRRLKLRSFSHEFVGHPVSTSNFIDYFVWHEDDADWQEGNGFLGVATYGEVLRLWTNSDYFVTYEARLLRFIRRGGETRRIFLLGPGLADPIRLWALQRTLLRHERLGFSPRVRSVLDLRAEIKRIAINCDMFGVLNGRIAYFLRFPASGAPIMLRTIDKKIVLKAENCFRRLLKNAEKFQIWYQRQKTKPPPELLKQVELDIAAVENVSQWRI